ncbi:putative alcohol dehydrogenase GroES-like domain [Lyophyllum shimeji]|uniref:alcohol dehydrogenase n=1 Tax=Lyophyllum shimeji TaxID=47721 RepID=A0A9P3PEN3_LYOSH|nr:putative alcohol dehydrogenase GroES-like domain [Lyophyllum shimeji]
MSSEIPKTARAAVLNELNGAYALKEEQPVKQASELAPGECLVKVEYSGVCHSDLHIKKGDWARKPILPLIGGHEAVGRVVAIGEHSDAGPVKVGDRVGIKWIADVCMKCEMCRKGNESCCPVSFARSHGFTVQGAFAEYVVSYINYVTPIPDNLDSAAATPILCAGLTVYKALKQANVRIGDWVAIPGAGGGLGHLAVQYAVAMGLRVVAIDTGEAKKDLCMKLGAEKWVDFAVSQDNIVQDVQAATDGLGPQAAIIAVGDVRPFNQALMYLRFTGTLVAVGLPGGNAMLNVPIGLLIAKSLTVLGSAIGNRQDVAEALQIAAQGKVKCQYRVRELSELNEIFDEMEAGKVAGRVILKI